MKGPTRAWKRSGVLIGAAAAGMIGVGLCAVPASAHTPTWSVTCSEVTVNLTAYNGSVDNTVTVTADGKELLPAKTFGSSYHTMLRLPQHTSELKVHLSVKAGDGSQFSKEDDKTAPVCEGTPTTPSKPSTPPASPSQKPTEKPSQQPSEKPSESAPAAAPAGDNSQPPKDQDLAETGSSSSTPIIAGAAALVVVAGGGILIATRRRSAAARH